MLGRIQVQFHMSPIDGVKNLFPDPRDMNERERERSSEHGKQLWRYNLSLKTQWDSFGSKWKRVIGGKKGKEMITCGIFRLDLLKFYLVCLLRKAHGAHLCYLWSK